MNTQIGLKGNFKSVPYIPENLSPKEVGQLFPPGFDDIIEYSIDEFTKSINITILTDTNKENTIITLSENLYNPSKNKCFFPKFLIEQHHNFPKIDY